MLLKSKALAAENLKKLANGDVLAVHVPHFMAGEVCAKLTARFKANGHCHYLNAPSIGRIGMAFYEAENQPALLSKYFEMALQNVSRLRGLCAPYQSPIDLLRCQLDEVWPAGAHIQTLYGRKMFVGLSRVVEPGITFLAHHDYFETDAPDCFAAHSLLAQIAANVYLTLPQSGGGELQIWAKEITPHDFARMRGGSYGINPQLLGAPDLEILPEAGDLVLFNSRKMHAVRMGQGAPRISLSCFIGYRGAHEPLTCWS